MTTSFTQDCRMCCEGCEGEEFKTFNQLTLDMRRELLEELKSNARDLGANAVIGVFMETNRAIQGAIEIVISGTAIQIARD